LLLARTFCRHKRTTLLLHISHLSILSLYHFPYTYASQQAWISTASLIWSCPQLSTVMWNTHFNLANIQYEIYFSYRYTIIAVFGICEWCIAARYNRKTRIRPVTAEKAWHHRDRWDYLERKRAIYYLLRKCHNWNAPSEHLVDCRHGE
jgi:hypothetical protein